MWGTKRSKKAGFLSEEVAKQHPLTAFSLLRGGDLLDRGKAVCTSNAQAAQAAIESSLRFGPAPGPVKAAIKAEMARALTGNPALSARMKRAIPIEVDVVRSARDMVALGYPRSAAQHAAGLFYYRSDNKARIALRLDRLQTDSEDTLVVHEYAHAIHRLGLSESEFDLMSETLRRTFSSPADQAEAFAIYSERELMQRSGFSKGEEACPGVYGLCRRQWNEDHVFAAFVRRLYRPGADIASGDRERRAGNAWKAFMG